MPHDATRALAPLRAQVDPDRALAPVERARRAKLAYRAHMRAIDRKGAKAWTANKARQDAARQRSLARPMNEKQSAEYHGSIASPCRFADALLPALGRGPDDQNLWKQQLERRDDCLLCGHPFSDEDHLAPTGNDTAGLSRVRRRPATNGALIPPARGFE